MTCAPFLSVSVGSQYLDDGLDVRTGSQKLFRLVLLPKRCRGSQKALCLVVTFGSW